MERCCEVSVRHRAIRLGIDGMILHYLYIKDYGCLTDARMHFSGKYRFRYSPRYGQLVVDVGAPLTEDFFSLSKDKKSKVDSVAAVVGANGAGKTSIARFLSALYIPRSSITDFVLFTEVNGENHCFYKYSQSKDYHDRKFQIIGVKDVVLHEWAPDNKAFDSVRNIIQFVYLTPHYTIDRQIISDGNELVDLSTRGLLDSRPEYYANQESGNRIQVSETLVFQSEQTEWMLLFAKALKENATVGVIGERQRWNYMSIPTPRGIRISINRIGKEVNRVHFANKDGGVRGGAADYNDIRQIVNSDTGSFFGNLFLMFAGNYWKDTGVREDVPNWDRSFSRALLEFCKVPFERTIEGTRSNVRDWYSPINIAQFFDSPDKYIGPKYFGSRGTDEHIAKARHFFRLIEMIKSLADDVTIVDTSTVYIPLKDEGSYDYLLKLLHAHRESCLITPMLQFEFLPSMSAGEMSAMSIWGRLYWHFVMQSKGTSSNSAPKNVVLFLDEAETTMHPSWQRKLVRTMILFFEKFVSGVNIQLIFSTHSPLMLSDIPMDNVCCLRRRRNGRTDSNSLKRSGMLNTFAASIADLYLLPYFMNEGTTGEFATKKANKLLREIKGMNGTAMASELSSESKEVAHIIGDAFIYRYIEKKLGKGVICAE